MTDIAKSNITGTDGEVEVGDEVSAEILGITDEEYEELVVVGAVEPDEDTKAEQLKAKEAEDAKSAKAEDAKAPEPTKSTKAS